MLKKAQKGGISVLFHAFKVFPALDRKTPKPYKTKGPAVKLGQF